MKRTFVGIMFALCTIAYSATATTVATPTFNPAAGTYNSAKSVTIACSTAGATIRYTTNGSDPTTSSTAYSGAIAVNSTTTIKAKAFKTGMTTSATATATYTIILAVATPTINPAAGTYHNGAQSVTMSCSTIGTIIRYTMNGTDPTSSSTVYSLPIKIVSSTTIKAKAFALVGSMTPSAIATATYTIMDPVKQSDVVGNDGFAGLSGHVGLYDGGGKFLEVYLGSDSYSINGTCVHYGRTLATFKGGGYWGARYDSSLSSSTLANVYDVFKTQGNSYKASYNLWLPSLHFQTASATAWVINTSTYRLEKKQVSGSAVLRCDFTVAAAYREKASKDLAPTGSWTPSSIFNNMPNSR